MIADSYPAVVADSYPATVAGYTADHLAVAVDSAADLRSAAVADSSAVTAESALRR